METEFDPTNSLIFALVGRDGVGEAVRFRVNTLFGTFASGIQNDLLGNGNVHNKMKIMSILPFLSVGNLLTVTVFELAIIRDALVCIFDGVVVTGFGVCDGV